MNALCRLSVLHLLILLPAGAPRAQSARLVPRDTFDLWFREVSNAGRWGSADELGTLNLISPAKRLAAARTVRAGISVSLSRQVTAGPDINALWPVEVQFRIVPDGDVTWFLDVATVPYHGFSLSHVDALSHTAFRGRRYNNYADSTVSATAGAGRLGVEAMQAGVVSRGVLVDVPWLRGVPYLELGTAITTADLAQWEQRTGVRIEQGDVVLIRTGRWAREAALGPWRTSDSAAGPHPELANWLRSRHVAALGADVANERNPSLVTGVSSPLHQLALAAMGMPLFDNLDLEAVSREAAARRQWTFLFVAAPLPVRGGSGSLVNALAVF